MNKDSLETYTRESNHPLIRPKCEYFELVQYKCTLLYDEAICEPYSRYFESCPNQSRRELTPEEMRLIHQTMKTNSN